MIINCTYCDEEFERKPSQIKRSKNNFCNKNCYNKWMTGKKNTEGNVVKHNCHQCDKEIVVPNYKFRKFLNGEFKNLFCDRKCQANWQSVNWKGENNHNYNSIKKNCEFCGEEFTTPKKKEKTAKYCSKNCRVEGRIIREEVDCNYCGTTFSKKPSLIRGMNFCDRECSSEWNSKFNNRQVEIECIICDRIFKVQRDRKDTAKSCSKECHYRWISEYYAKTEEGQKHYRNLGINTTLNQKYSETKPERIFKEFLIHNNIKFISQYLMYDKFIVDFYLPEKNMVIEVFGDYWHGNPLFYGEKEGVKPLTKKQIKQKKKDKSREAYLKKCGHEFYILWENDIYHKLSKITNFLIK